MVTMPTAVLYFLFEKTTAEMHSYTFNLSPSTTISTGMLYGLYCACFALLTLSVALPCYGKIMRLVSNVILLISVLGQYRYVGCSRKQLAATATC